MTDTVTVNGVEYPSARAVAIAHGIGYSTLRARIKTGKTLEEAVSLPINDPGQMNNKSVTHKNIVYPSHKDLCARLGISYSTYNSNRRRGMCTATAIHKTQQAAEQRSVNGFVYVSAAQVAKHFKIEYGTLTARIRKGQSMQKIVDDLAS